MNQLTFKKPKLKLYYTDNQLYVENLYNNYATLLTKYTSRLKKKIAAVPGDNSIPHNIALSYTDELMTNFRDDFYQNELSMNFINYNFISGRTGEGVCGCRLVDINNMPYIAEAYLYGMDDELLNKHIYIYKTTENMQHELPTEEMVNERANLLYANYYLLCLIAYKNYNSEEPTYKEIKSFHKDDNVIAKVNNYLLDFITEHGLVPANSTLSKSWLS